MRVFNRGYELTMHYSDCTCKCEVCEPRATESKPTFTREGEVRVPIDPQKAPELFRKLAITPKQGVWYRKVDGEPCTACLTGALAVNAIGFVGVEVPANSTSPIEEFAEVLNVSPKTIEGISEGWDGNTLDPESDPDLEEGHRIGCAAWKACCDAGLVPAMQP